MCSFPLPSPFKWFWIWPSLAWSKNVWMKYSHTLVKTIAIIYCKLCIWHELHKLNHVFFSNSPVEDIWGGWIGLWTSWFGPKNCTDHTFHIINRFEDPVNTVNYGPKQKFWCKLWIFNYFAHRLRITVFGRLVCGFDCK